jgi:tetratricopeptide (TPR) repeat protein
MQYVEGQTLAEVIRDLRRVEGLDEEEVGGCRAESGKRKAEVGKGGEKVESALADSLASGEFAPLKAGCRADAPTAAYAQETTPDVADETGRSRQPPISSERSTKSPAYFRSIAEIGVQVARALDHAHEQGVIHRDVKPSNVILDAQGKPWITDFGLARIETNATLTISGDLLGTVRYMSPEQALAKRIVVDHRTDVYSLGVTLYELLTLQPAFTGQDREELLRQIAFEEPRAPRRLNRSVPAELETIVLKAMAKNPAERYDTAQELADDLERFLEDKPIRAKRPSLVQRVTKWSRRHKPVVGAAVVLLVMATVGFALSTYFVAQQKKRAEDAFDRQRDLTREASRLRGQAERNLKRARDNLGRALDAADQLVGRVADERAFNQPQMLGLRLTLLEDALELYRSFLDEHTTDAVVQYQAARAYGRIGMIQSSMGRYPQAEDALQRAVGLLEHLVAESPSQREYRERLAWNHLQLGLLHWWGYRRPLEGEVPLRRAVRLHEELVADYPDASRSDLVRSYRGLAEVLTAKGESEKAEKLHRQWWTLAEELAREFPTDAEYSRLLRLAWQFRGRRLARRGKSEDALEAFRKSVEIQEQLVDDGYAWYRFESAGAYRELGHFQAKSGELEEAERSYRKAIALLEQDTANRHLESGVLLWLARCYRYLGNLLKRMQRMEEATQQYRREVGTYEKRVTLAPDVPLHQQRLAESYGRLGSFLEETAQLEGAEEAYRQQQRIHEKLTDEYPQDLSGWTGLVDTWIALGSLLNTMGRRDEAGKHWDDAQAFVDRAVESNPGEAHPLQVRGQLYARHAQWEKAAAEYNKAIRLAPEDPGLYMDRARAYLELGRNNEALSDLDRWAEQGPDNAVWALIRAQMLLMADRAEEYRQACGEIIDRFGQSENPGRFCHAARACVLAPKAVPDPMVPVKLAAEAVSRDPIHWHLYTLGMAHLRAGQLDEAAQRFHESLNTDPAWQARFLNWLGLALVHHGRGEMEEARQCFGEAVDLMEQDPGPTPQDRIEGRLLRREVEQLLGKPEEKDE